MVVGAVGYVSFYMGGLFAILLGPLAYAAWRPNAPISQPVIWLKHLTGKDSFLLTYLLIQGFVAITLFCGSMLFEYLRFKKLLKKNKTEQDPAANP